MKQHVISQTRLSIQIAYVLTTMSCLHKISPTYTDLHALGMLWRRCDVAEDYVYNEKTAR